MKERMGLKHMKGSRNLYCISITFHKVMAINTMKQPDIDVSQPANILNEHVYGTKLFDRPTIFILTLIFLSCS